MEQLVLIKKLDEIQPLYDYIQNNDFIAFDVETTGVDKEAKIIGMSFSADDQLAYYIVLSYWDVEHQKLVELETQAVAKILVEMLLSKDLIMHNGPFDCAMVKTNYGVELIHSLHTDTLVLAHLLDENRHNGLKELGTSLFGDDARTEQLLMKESVHKNGGQLTKEHYELYKADADLIGRYGAKDAILTIKIFYVLVEELYKQGLEDFFYLDESMPLLRGPTYQLNTSGLMVDPTALQKLKSELEASCLEAKAYIDREVAPAVAEKYPGTKKTNHFNIGSSKQLAWLLFIKLNNPFETLTKEGRNVCKALSMKMPYSYKAKREFIQTITQLKGKVYEEAVYNKKTSKMSRPKKVGEVWNYLAADKATLKVFAPKYRWVEKFLEYNKNLKLLTTYVEGVQSRMRYNIIRPSFLQHGTTSGRYSSKNPNFQNLPRDDKRVKACIVSRPGKVFVGADYSQLEPRVFASFSNDERLQKCFTDGDDFYSVIGTEVFDKFGYSLKKDAEGSFAATYPQLRNIAKVIGLSATYGTTAPKMAPAIGKELDEAQEIIDNYFERFPKVKTFMLESHALAIRDGFVKNLFGRPRRMPQAKAIPSIYGKTPHNELPYEARNILNLAVNHRVQSTGASIVNRASIAFYKAIKETGIEGCYIVLQIHDEIVVECKEIDSVRVSLILKECMEHTVELPNVVLIAEPKIGKNLAELK